MQRNYAYNGKGEQVRKYLGATSTYTVYDEAGRWLGDYDNTGAALQQAIWMDDLPVGLIANSNQLHYIEPDHLGTPRVVIEVARNVPVWTWDLKGEAFGNSAPNQNPDGDANTLVFDMRFPGQQYDAASELNQNGNRDYDPAIGRYPKSDPLGLRGGINTYSYAYSSPLMWIDPDGLQAVVPISGPGMTGAAGAAGAYNPYNPNNPNNVNPDLPPQNGGWSGPNISIPDILNSLLAQSSAATLINSVAQACQGDDDGECESAKNDARRAYNELRYRSIPHYMYATRHGSADAGHHRAITEGQRALRNAISRVRAHCKQEPPEMMDWTRLANDIFPARH